MRTSLATPVAAILLSATIASTATAQSRDKANSCRKAVKTAKEASELAMLGTCGKKGAVVLARAMHDSRMEIDPVVLTRLYSDVDLWRDAEVMEAAITLARDASAATPSRVFAIRHLLGLIDRRAEFDYESLIMGTRIVTGASIAQYISGGCRFAMGSELADVSGTLLPSEFRTRLRAVLRQLSEDATSAVAVPNAADCGK